MHFSTNGTLFQLMPTLTIPIGAHPDVNDVGVLCLEQHVDFSQRGDREAFLFLLHLQLLQSHYIACRMQELDLAIYYMGISMQCNQDRYVQV